MCEAMKNRVDNGAVGSSNFVDDRSEFVLDELRRRRHDFRDSHTILTYIISLIREGYDFKDQDAKGLLRDLERIADLLKKEGDSLFPS